MAATLEALAQRLWVARRSLQLIVGDIGTRMTVVRIFQWDFDRVVVTHGDVLESGGQQRFADAFAFLLPVAGARDRRNV